MSVGRLGIAVWGIGDFEIERELGRGATARVCLARHRHTQETVCLKIFYPHIFQDSAFYSRLRRELALTESFFHTNIVQIKEFLESPDSPALVMEYIEGENLASFQSRLPYVLPEISAAIIAEVLNALTYAHSRGVIHRDLKPENILVAKSGRVLLTDFGLAKTTNGTKITQVNEVVGTVDYMSPEQVRGDLVDERSDLYSLAAIFYFLTTGTRPFSRASTLATLAAVERDDVEPPQRRNPKLSATLTRIICKGLSKDPAKRYQTAVQFRADLVSYLTGLGLDDGNLFGAWKSDPAGATLEALNLAAETLAKRAERALSSAKQEEFLGLLAELSLKAPSSPALPRLMSAYRNRRGKRFWLVGLSAGVTTTTILLFLWWPRFHTVRKELTGPAAASPSVPTFAPREASIAPPTVVAPRTTTPKGTIIFKVGDGVIVFVDGRQVNPEKPLRNVPVGKHFVLLQRAGHDPIRAEVNVTITEPTVINVR